MTRPAPTSPKTADAGPDDPGGRGRAGQRLSRTLMGTLTTYHLIEDGDRILCALSGGWASAALLDLLRQARRRAPVRYELLAVHVAPAAVPAAAPGEAGGAAADAGSAMPVDEIRAWAAGLGVPFEVVSPEDAPPGGGPIAAGVPPALPGAAARLGCNKIALGHHREDALEALLRGLLQEGVLAALPAREPAAGGPGGEVIRPLIECAAGEVAAHAAARGYPVRGGPARGAMDRLLGALEAEVPDLRAVMLHALKNVRPTHLLDPELAAAWSTRAAEHAADRADRPLPSWRRALRVVDRDPC